MPLPKLRTGSLRPVGGDDGSLLSPGGYDDDASSVHSRSDQDTDSDDDELQSRARNSRELRAADRIMLMEEDEMDELVTSSRRQQERQRRGSGLALSNPLKMLGRRPSQIRRMSAGSSADTLVNEKKEARRARRQRKRDRLIGDAQHGEDRELMYEMESGAMKEGSSTGDSSNDDDSEHIDQQNLSMVTDEKARRKSRWRRWLLLHTIIAIGFAILVLAAWKLSKGRRSVKLDQDFVSNGTAFFAPTTILISLDGFRADFLQRGLTPRLNQFIKEGVSPKYMLPSFPSVTFPNHYTLATGLYPECHGIVGNTFWDPDLEAEFYYTDPARSLDPKWWGGEPFWVTAENQGIRTAIHMWPGSEAHIAHLEPSFVDKFNGQEKLENKVSRIFEYLDKPGKEDQTVDVKHMRPQVIAAYVPNVDHAGHKWGPNSTEIRSTIEEVDKMVDDIFVGLEHRNLTEIVNVVVVSDHGMATTDASRSIQLEDLVDTDKIEHIDGWPLYGLRPKNPDDLQSLYDGLAEKAKSNPNFEVYLRDKNMPERYHFSNNKRIAPLWIVPKTGWAIVTKDEFDVEEGKEKNLVLHPRGLHGYDHEHPLMRAIFIARGPAFPHPPNSQIENFQNTEVYNILCDSVGIKAKPNNGTLHLPLKPIGEHKPEETPATPDDPVSNPADGDDGSIQYGDNGMPIGTEDPTAGQPDGSPDDSGLGDGQPSDNDNASGAPNQSSDNDTDGENEDSKPNHSDDGGSNQPADGDGDQKEGGGGLWGWLTDTWDEIWDKITGNSGSKKDDKK